MFWSLKKKLPLLFVIVSAVSVIIVSIITNITIQKQFGSYMKENQDARNTNTVQTFVRIYEAKGGWSGQDFKDAVQPQTFSGMDIKVRDTNGNIIFVEVNTNQMMMGHMRMMGMGSEYVEKTFPMLVNDTTVGYVDIGYYGAFSLSIPDISFLNAVNKSIFSAAIISALAALILSFVIARGITSPIVRLTQTANSIKEGKFEARYTGSANNLEIAELSSAINSLAESLQSNEAVRKRMTSDIAHELRTPLTTLKSHIEAIVDGVWEMTPERLESCYEEVIRLSRLVKSLEQLNILESDVPNLEKMLFNLSDTTLRIAETFKPQFLEKDIAVNLDIDNNVEISADRDKISQVIINLLSNAYKYSNIGGSVGITVSRDKENAYIRVSDTGIGISQKDLGHVFDRFYRGEKSRSRDTGGAGIGLAITHAIVRAHEGKISVKSEIDKGSEFTVILPLKSP